MSVICLIPARLQSRRFPFKLLQEVAGKTILQYTFEQAKLSSSIDMIYIATSDLEIAREATRFGAPVLLTSNRPRSGTERIAEALCQLPSWKKAAYFINLQGDHPLVSPNLVEEMVDVLRCHPRAIVATPITPIRTIEDFNSPHIVKCVCNLEGEALYFSRSPIPYGGLTSTKPCYGHIGIYGYRPSFFEDFVTLSSPTPLSLTEDLEQLSVLERGKTIQTWITQEPLLGIDTPEDLIRFACVKNSPTATIA
jgi:3-deoxy-manno-octulosonate cytidylyltransferase (CMP-KDO synthetase)